MDAKPQRPLRTLHIASDENAPPFAQPTLHQRHKSTGTLHAMLNGGGGGKAATKRTAFGDVSNTVKHVTAFKDDSALAGKAGFVKPSIHSVQLVPKKVPTLLRPAQRPLNQSSLKNFLSHHATKPTTASTATTITHLDATVDVQPALIKTEIKRTIRESHDAAVPASVPSLAPRSYKSLPQLPQVLLDPVAEAAQVPLPDVPDVIEELAIEDESKVRGEPVHQDAPELPVEEHKDVYESYLRMMHQAARDAQPVQEETIPSADVIPAPPSSAPLASEPDEYWEEEDDEEIYDEQGYTTAHSCRSRGDNTTGGATVLFPKVTNKVRKELALAKELVESAKTPDEIEDEMWDTSMVAEYGDEIFEYMRDLELRMLPNPHYMDNQAEIQWSMRSVLMDWLVQVHHRFSLLPETLFLCVNYIDRFLTSKVVSLGKLQLVGATAIFVAAKYEEINCPSVGEIVYMVDGGYSVDEILKAERFMLSMLQFELGWPGPMSFLRRVSKADDYDLETRTLAKYFLEVTIMDERFVGSPPSFLAAGAHCLARLMLKKGDWSTAHVHYSGYTWSQLKPLVALMCECCENPQQHHSAIFEKYSDRRYKRASVFVQGEIQKGFQLPTTQPRTSLPSLPSPEEPSPLFESRDSYKRMVSIKG